MRELDAIIAQYDQLKSAGTGCILATVVHVVGSSYRRAGARMLIDEIGNITGAISGGCLEGDALRKALPKNMVEGGTIDGIGHALYSEITFKDGVPQQSNYDKYRLIRHKEAPKTIDVHFVDNGIDPTGLGEPPFPPVMGALANALYKATGKRFYKQPFISEMQGALKT